MTVPRAHADPPTTHVSYEMTDVPDVPMIWLDTHAVSHIAASRSSVNPDSADIVRRNLYDRLVSLRQANRIVAFESDQLWEIEARPELVERCMDVLTGISQGVSTSYHTVKERQLGIGMQASLAGALSAPIPWRTAFTDDPFADHTIDGSFFLRARFPPSPQEIHRRKASYRSIAEQWESLRQAQVGQGRPHQERLHTQVDREQRGMCAALWSQIDARNVRIEAGREPTDEELVNEAYLLGAQVSKWRARGGDGLEDLLDFYESPHYLGLPYVDIESHLGAWRIIGVEPIESGDVMDIHHISAFMPYCTHMVLDRSMINAVRNLRLDERYATVILRLDELDGVLDQIAGEA